MTPSSGLIPGQLSDSTKKGDYVLFLGADLPLGYAGAPLSRPELAAALAQKYDLPSGRSWPETASAYLGKYRNDRNGLIRFLLEHTSRPDVRAGDLHHAIARAGFRAIVSAWYDELLEQTLRQAGYRVHRVAHDVQMPYSQQGERDVTVIKLFGCVSDPRSLILTERDKVRLIARLDHKLKAIIAFAAIRPLLFVGHDLSDDILMHLYERASENIVQHMQRAYAVWPQPSEAMRASWQDVNLEFLSQHPTPFLQALAIQTPPAEQPAAPIRAHKPPYKFLDYYTQDDADIFCGRDAESQLVFRLALSGRVLTLFGPSGAGKTSLLLAGVLPRLEREGYKSLYLRALNDPLPVLCRAIAARFGGDGAAPPSSGDLRAVLAEYLRSKDRLVVVFDQFEELFLRVGSQARRVLFQQVAGAVKDAQSDVRFIFSLREDYLARLDEARAFLPDVFANSFRLKPLDRGNARRAITEPAERAGVEVETTLVDALVGHTGAESSMPGDLVEADGTVPPPALQIVMDRLYRAALPADYKAGVSPPPGLPLNLAHYQALRGAGDILASYVDDGLAKLKELHGDDGMPLRADPALGEALLKVMVTSQKTKTALTHDDLLEELAEAGVLDPDDEDDRRRAERTRLGLERARLLRGFRREGLALYELAHDHIADEIARRISPDEMQAKLARELLRRQMDNWRHAELLIPSDALSLIYEKHERLRRLHTDELLLLLMSALPKGYPVNIWVSHVKLLEKEFQLKVLNEVAKWVTEEHPENARQSALEFLAAVGVEDSISSIIESLFDTNLFVREVAHKSLGSFRAGVVIRKLAEECLAADSRRRLLAALNLRYLADLQDVVVLNNRARMTPEQATWMEQARQIVHSPKTQVPHRTPNMVCLSVVDRSDFASSIANELVTKGHLVDTILPQEFDDDIESRVLSVETLLNYQIVLLFRGDAYSEQGLPVLKSRLLNFVQAGGTLIATPFVAWEDVPHLNSILPVRIKYPSGYHGNRPITWKIQGEHPLCHGLPPTISFKGSYESLVSVPDAKVLITDNNENPALALKTSGLGKVIYLNVCNFMCSNPWNESNELRRIFINAFDWLTRQYCD